MEDETFTGEIKTIKANNESNLEVFKEKSDIAEEGSHEQPDTTNMFDLQSEESAEQRRNQSGQGLKILTPDQMLSRLPITFAQLKVENNSPKLINEIRQLLHSLYLPKKINQNNL